MTGNPKTSPWYSTGAKARKRPAIKLTLSPAALARLEELAERRQESRSQVVESLVLAAERIAR